MNDHMKSGRGPYQDSMPESIYGDNLPAMQKVMEEVADYIGNLRDILGAHYDMDPVEHCLCRIKSEESMREKCRRRGLPETTESALNEIQDAIGFRIVCVFLKDVYTIIDRLKDMKGFEVVKEKDYIRHVKPNGYRSYHLILRYKGKYFVEFQIRTISMDTWAALEHQMKYKKDIGGNVNLITSELKRCADTLASTDISMQAIRDMIMSEDG